jgi:hypothetical protein
MAATGFVAVYHPYQICSAGNAINHFIWPAMDACLVLNLKRG